MSVHIGTSGYSFSGWKKEFYPEEVKSKDMLDYYAKLFNIVEINTTYYAVRDTSMFENMKSRVSDNFLFVIKANKKMTHEIDKDFFDVCQKYQESLIPLKESNQFVGTLIQFPWSFKNREKNRKHILLLREQLDDDNLFIEFRHNSWIIDPIFDFLQKNDLHYVIVDEPQLKGMVPPVIKTTSDLAYIRLHGRNKKTWWGGGSERYDYDYSTDELLEWKKIIEKLEDKSRDIFAFFNNCHKAHAPRNAIEMKQMFL